MKGQAATEVLLILAVVLTAALAFLPAGEKGNEVSSVMSAAREGASRAVTELNMQYGCAIDIAKLNFDGGNITIYLTASVGGPPDATISDEVRNEALKYIHQVVRGSFPENVGPIRTQNYTYDVSVTITRVTK